MKTRKEMVEDSYVEEIRITVNAGGLFFSGVVVDINEDGSFVLMTRVMCGEEEFDTFYLDEVVRDIEPYLLVS